MVELASSQNEELLDYKAWLIVLRNSNNSLGMLMLRLSVFQLTNVRVVEMKGEVHIGSHSLEWGSFSGDSLGYKSWKVFSWLVSICSTLLLGMWGVLIFFGMGFTFNRQQDEILCLDFYLLIFWIYSTEILLCFGHKIEIFLNIDIVWSLKKAIQGSLRCWGWLL